MLSLDIQHSSYHSTHRSNATIINIILYFSRQAYGTILENPSTSC